MQQCTTTYSSHARRALLYIVCLLVTHSYTNALANKMQQPIITHNAARNTLRNKAKPARHYAGKMETRLPNKRRAMKMAKTEKNAAAQAAPTLTQVLGALPSTARTAAPVTPPKQPASECGKAWVLAAFAAKTAGAKPNGETLRQLAGENSLNSGNVVQEAARYFRWLAQNGHSECSGTLPEAWNVTL